MRNNREPDFETLKKIAEYFHVTTDYLLDYSAGTCNDSRDQIILQVFHSLTEEQKDIYIEQGKVFIVTIQNGGKSDGKRCVKLAYKQLFMADFTSEESPMLLVRQSRARRCPVLNSYYL